MEDMVFFSKKGNAITDSLRVAKGFGKTHKHVLRDILNLECDTDFRAANFAAATYADKQGKRRPSIVMTRKGFTFLVTGFTGKRAAEFKQNYIEQFDRMEAQLQQQQSAPVALPEFTKREVQVACVKQVATHLMRPNNDPQDIIQHHRGVMRCLTGKTPAQYVQAAVKTGLRVASFSGRALLRRLEPAKACTAAFMDDQLRRGRSLEQLTDAGIHRVLPQAFDAMLRCGITPAELGMAA